jgi:arsenate reductase
MTKIKVLFLCTHNSSRSQMAEGLLRHLYGERFEVFSAGASPTHVNPRAIQAMAEIGIDISTQHSKSIDAFRQTDIDVVVSLCRSSPTVTCPVCALPPLGDRPTIITETVPSAKHYVDHGFRDPSEIEGSDEEKMAAFRLTRDDIKQWIPTYFADLAIDDID